MSNTYHPILLNKITDEVVIEILNTIIPVFKELEIKYFVVGAFARDIALLSKGHDENPFRKTEDIDLAIMLSSAKEFNRLKQKLTQIDGFEAHPTEAIKFIFKDKYELDILPFGEIENEKGIVELKAKKAFSLNMPGFAEVFKSVHTIETDQDFELNVCSLSGIVLLKLIAWDDRKERTKDIQDIEYIIRNLYMLDIDEIVTTENDLLELLENENNYTEAVTARYIGRKIGELAKDSNKVITRLTQILQQNIHDAENSPIGIIMSFDTLEESVNIIKQLYLGIQDKTN